MKGQVLFSCPDCNSPVPSPILSRVKEVKNPVLIQKIEVTETPPLPPHSLDSGFNLSLTPSVSQSGDSSRSREEHVFKTPESFIDISQLVTPTMSPYSMDGDTDERISEESPSQDISISSISLNDSVLGPSQMKSEEEVSKLKIEVSQAEVSSTNGSSLSVEVLRDGSLYQQNSYLLNSPLPPFNHSKDRSASASVSSLLVKELKSDSAELPQFTKTLPSMDSSGWSSLEEVPDVAECPECSYRFCSRCQFKEHPAQPCRLIGATDDTASTSNSAIGCTNINFHYSRSGRKMKGPSSGKQASKKSHLRRLAML